MVLLPQSDNVLVVFVKLVLLMRTVEGQNGASDTTSNQHVGCVWSRGTFVSVVMLDTNLRPCISIRRKHVFERVIGELAEVSSTVDITKFVVESRIAVS